MGATSDLSTSRVCVKTGWSRGDLDCPSGYGVEVRSVKHKAKFATSLFSLFILSPFIQYSP